MNSHSQEISKGPKINGKVGNPFSSANSTEIIKTTGPPGTKTGGGVRTRPAIVPKTSCMRALRRTHGLQIIELGSEIPSGFRSDATLEAVAISNDPARKGIYTKDDLTDLITVFA